MVPIGRIAGIKIRLHVLTLIYFADRLWAGFSTGPTYGLLMLTLNGPILWSAWPQKPPPKTQPHA